MLLGRSAIGPLSSFTDTDSDCVVFKEGTARKHTQTASMCDTWNFTRRATLESQARSIKTEEEIVAIRYGIKVVEETLRCHWQQQEVLGCVPVCSKPFLTGPCKFFASVRCPHQLW